MDREHPAPRVLLMLGGFKARAHIHTHLPLFVFKAVSCVWLYTPAVWRKFSFQFVGDISFPRTICTNTHRATLAQNNSRDCVWSMGRHGARARAAFGTIGSWLTTSLHRLLVLEELSKRKIGLSLFNSNHLLCVSIGVCVCVCVCGLVVFCLSVGYKLIAPVPNPVLLLPVCHLELDDFCIIKCQWCKPPSHDCKNEWLSPRTPFAALLSLSVFVCVLWLWGGGFAFLTVGSTLRHWFNWIVSVVFIKHDSPLPSSSPPSRSGRWRSLKLTESNANLLSSSGGARSSRAHPCQLSTAIEINIINRLSSTAERGSVTFYNFGQPNGNGWHFWTPITPSLPICPDLLHTVFHRDFPFHYLLQQFLHLQRRVLAAAAALFARHQTITPSLGVCMCVWSRWDGIV